ncbi:HIT family protein [Pelagibaculum spongiae]|uniref:HIT family protein n=1 Tax=Pelagibaculum spongiae TaxID=2080658 RepID=UPI0013146FA0|nr:HIT family protein [Pelagibaculum spongiae]
MKCIFCDVLSNKQPASVVLETEHCLVIADLFPLTAGHILLVSKTHQEKLTELSEIEMADLFLTARKIAPVLQAVTGADACHWLVNDGKAAWQHVPHVHLHLIPRYKNRPLQLLLGILTRPFMWLGLAQRRRRLDDFTHQLAEAIKETSV